MSTAALALALDPLTRNTGAKLVGELGDEVIVDAVLHGAEDNDGSGVVNWDREEQSLLRRTQTTKRTLL